MPEMDGATLLAEIARDYPETMRLVLSGFAEDDLILAAINEGREDRPLRTASLRVNYIRQFVASPKSRYVGTALRVGRRSGIGEAQAIGPDGKAAIVARLTAYA